MEAFLEFYSDLYKPSPTSSRLTQNTFLDLLPLPTLLTDHRDLLDSPFTQTEVLDAIKSLKEGSSPGPDGFSNGYYKKFGPSLAPHLTRVFNALREGTPLSADLNSAYISVISKPGKDTGKVGNYHPISLINNDIKIMTKILANRVTSFIPSYIH